MNLLPVIKLVADLDAGVEQIVGLGYSFLVPSWATFNPIVSSFVAVQ